jgi:hypothetical protein
VNFLVDAQLPPALALWITGQGHQATHVFDLGFHTADDPVIWERARSEQAVIISKDEDFVDHWLLSNQTGGIHLDSQRQLFEPRLLEWLEPLWPDAVKRLEQGEKFLELRA